MDSFNYMPMVSATPGKETTFSLLTSDLSSIDYFRGEEVLLVEPKALTLLSERAFFEVNHLLRTSHLEKVAAILKDEEASENDKYVALELLRNAVIASQKVFPSCQDTGTAIIQGKKGERVFTGCDDAEALSRGVYNTYQKANLRYSQLAPLSMYQEKNTKTNLPAQIEIYSKRGSQYEFLFVAKGGGSANKTFLFQETKSLLNPDSMKHFLQSALKKLGTAACPPYHLAFVVGGTSAEFTLKMVKLASCGYLDTLPTTGSEAGIAYRDLEMEKKVERIARETGIGAQFGGKYFVHDVRVIRLPRHGASCPVGIGVSCSADRQILGKIDSSGVFLEQLEEDPARFLPENTDSGKPPVRIDLGRPMKEILAELDKLPVATRVMLSGTLIVARDIAHAKILEKLNAGEDMPEYLKEFPVYYAGPAKTPDGFASGSFGPTTSQRMDPYVAPFQSRGGSMIMLGKGNRSAAVTESCKQYGGVYLGSIGGPAARIGKDFIKKVEVHQFPELGMEAVWKIEVEDFPAFIIVDNKGNDFFAPERSGSLGIVS